MQTTPQLTSPANLHSRFDFSRYDNIHHIDKEVILFYDGDTQIDGDLDANYISNLVEHLGGNKSSSILMMVNGDLIVKGTIRPGADGSPSLLVIGNVMCAVLQNYDEAIYITGDAQVKYVFDGNYNHGTITIEGALNVPYLLNSDHHSDVQPNGAILINYHSNQNDFFTYDYTTDDFERVMVQEVFHESRGFDQSRFIAWVRAGNSPLKEGALPQKALFEQRLEEKINTQADTLEELDLTDQKFDHFPIQVTKFKNLRKLVLDKNPITNIPDEIGLLQNLRELHLKACGLEKISSQIALLRNLEVLNLSLNRDLAVLPKTIGDLSNLKTLNVDYIPVQMDEHFASLKNLQFLSMYSCYRDMENIAPFPLVITKMQNLRTLDLRENIIAKLPPELVDLKQLEEFLWTGSRTHDSSFPDFTQFKHLRKLLISSKFNTWKNVIFRLTSLEHLNIDRNSEQKEYFTDDMLEYWQEMAEESPEKFEALGAMIANKKKEADGRWSVVTRPGMNADDLADIGNLKQLTYLDLSYNKLPYLPESFYELKNLKSINLYSNNLSDEEKSRVKQVFPTAEITF